MSRCSGHCCRVVKIPVPVDWIRMMTPLPENSEMVWVGSRDDGTGNMVKIILPKQEAEIVGAMLDPIDSCLERPAWWTEGSQPSAGHEYSHTCKHWDDVTGDCRNYDERPRMCRDYPYDRACSEAGCTMVSECAGGHALESATAGDAAKDPRRARANTAL